MNSEAIPLGSNNVNPGQLCETHGIASHNSPPGITPTHGITPSHLICSSHKKNYVKKVKNKSSLWLTNTSSL